MAERTRTIRTRYPLHAILAVGGASLLFLFDMVAGFLFMALVPPLIPIYVCVLFGAGCLVGNALEYATRVSIRAPAGMLAPGKHEEKVADRAFTARAA